MFSWERLICDLRCSVRLDALVSCYDSEDESKDVNTDTQCSDKNALGQYDKANNESGLQESKVLDESHCSKQKLVGAQERPTSGTVLAESNLPARC